MITDFHTDLLKDKERKTLVNYIMLFYVASLRHVSLLEGRNNT